MADKNETDTALNAVLAISDEVNDSNMALKALSKLIESSDLSAFADCDPDNEKYKARNLQAAELRYGLSQIIELSLSRQETILAKHVEKYSQIEKLKIA